MIEVLFFLLPLAAASGWWLAQRERTLQNQHSSPTHPEFLRGLNYLLAEQPDQALDLFMKLAEVDGGTLETHLALGNLFRRRGEVDRAIRIHQNLVARKNLSSELRGYALFELGQDYMRAGLLDRAEELFRELVNLGLHRQRALNALREIYRQEGDWTKCLEVAQRLQTLTDQVMVTEIAHYHCELAEEARRVGKHELAHQNLISAQEIDPHCSRPILLEGRMALEDGEFERAISLLFKLAERSAGDASAVIPLLLQASQHRKPTEVLTMLEDLAQRQPSAAVLLSLAEVLAQNHGNKSALDLLARYLNSYADLAVLERFLTLQIREFQNKDNNSQQRQIEIALKVINHLVTQQTAYQCTHCGFAARALHWHCPSCKSWETIEPVLPDLLN